MGLNPFSRRKQPVIAFPLHFKNAVTAVEYASRYMNCELAPGVELPAVVFDGLNFGLDASVQITTTGNQMAALGVSGDGGAFLVVAETSGSSGPRLEPGDLVSWRAFKYIPDLGRTSGDKRTGWAGVIVGVLTPTLVAEGWVGKERFRV